jgi:hypothetical protein
MYRLTLCVATLLLCFGLVFAETHKAKIKSVDEEKRTITFDVAGMEKTFDVAKDAKLYGLGKAAPGQPPLEIPVTLGMIKDRDATITTNKSDVVTEVKLEPVSDAKKKKTKKNK